MSRTRSRTLLTPGGTWGRLNNGPGTNPSPGGNITEGIETCTDEIFQGDGHDLTITKSKWIGGRIQKPYSGYYSSWFNNYACTYIRGRDADGTRVLSLPDMPSNSWCATDCVAKTNPNREEVSVPLFLYEIREIPALIKGFGDRIIRAYADAHLRYEFGIKPMAADLVKFASFSHMFHKRMKEIERLNERGLRRTIHHGSWSESQHYSGNLHSNGATFLGKPMTKTTTAEKWSYVKWTPNRDTLDMDPREMMQKVLRVVYGLSVDSQFLWNAIPWSWLVDWGTNMGDYLSTRRNLIGASHSPVEVMTHTTTETSFGSHRDGTAALSPGRIVHETKVRRRSNPSISAHLPIMNSRQFSILGSLAVLSRDNRVKIARY